MRFNVLNPAISAALTLISSLPFAATTLVAAGSSFAPPASAESIWDNLSKVIGTRSEQPSNVARSLVKTFEHEPLLEMMWRHILDFRKHEQVRLKALEIDSRAPRIMSAVERSMLPDGEIASKRRTASMVVALIAKEDSGWPAVMRLFRDEDRYLADAAAEVIADNLRHSLQKPAFVAAMTAEEKKDLLKSLLVNEHVFDLSQDEPGGRAAYYAKLAMRLNSGDEPLAMENALRSLAREIAFYDQKKVGAQALARYFIEKRRGLKGLLELFLPPPNRGAAAAVNGGLAVRYDSADPVARAALHRIREILTLPGAAPDAFKSQPLDVKAELVRAMLDSVELEDDKTAVVSAILKLGTREEMELILASPDWAFRVDGAVTADMARRALSSPLLSVASVRVALSNLRGVRTISDICERVLVF